MRPARDSIPVYTAALSTFAVVTTEMLPVGLIASIAQGLGTSIGTAGLMISIPAILAAVFSPAIIIAAGSIDRRRVLAGLLALLVVANAASALATSIGVLLAARGLVGFCMGGIWAIAGGLAPRLVPEASVGSATAIIFGGVAAASLLGVPIGATIGNFAGWRWAFGAMAGLSAAVLALNLWALPALPMRHSVRIGQFTAMLAQRPARVGLIVTLLLVAGHFMAYTFVGPTLLTLSGVGPEWLAILLFGYGAAGIAGNFLAGAAAVRRMDMTLAVIAVALGGAILGLAVLGGTPVGGAAILTLWGAAYGGVSVSLQTWMMRAAPKAIEIATALFVSVFNIGIAAGSFIGGQIVDRAALHTNLLAAAILPIAALLAIHRRANT